MILIPWRWRDLVPISEHLGIGAGTEVGISELAGGPQKYAAGITAAALVAAFKEGSDVRAHRDTKRSGFVDALEIIAGAGIAAAIRH